MSLNEAFKWAMPCPLKRASAERQQKSWDSADVYHIQAVQCTQVLPLAYVKRDQIDQSPCFAKSKNHDAPPENATKTHETVGWTPKQDWQNPIMKFMKYHPTTRGSWLLKPPSWKDIATWFVLLWRTRSPCGWRGPWNRPNSLSRPLAGLNQWVGKSW